MPETKFSREEMNILEKGPNYDIQKCAMTYLKDLVIETEKTIRHLGPQTQPAYRLIAAKKIKQGT